jgi:uncharacterized protein YbjT (DUF2867 family)
MDPVTVEGVGAEDAANWAELEALAYGRGERVVLTGADHDVGRAIRRLLLKRGLAVVDVERGDDIVAAAADARAVVVLDGASGVGQVGEYRVALHAVGEALRQSRADTRVVSVLLLPGDSRSCAKVVKRADAAETSFRMTKRPLAAFHSSTVIGTPAQPGPSDAVLFKQRGSSLRALGDGKQKWTPLLIDDLAEMLVAAVTAPAPMEGTFHVGGPETTVGEVLRHLNPGVALGHMGVPPFLLRRMLADVQIPARDQVARNSQTVQKTLGTTVHDVKHSWKREDAVAKRESEARWKAGVEAYRHLPTSKRVGAFFAVLAVLAGAAAFGDVHADLPGVRLSAISFAAPAIMFLFGAYALLKSNWPSRFAIGFLAAVVAGLMGVFLCVAWAASPDPPEWTILFLGLVVAAIYCAQRLWKRGGLAVATFITTRGTPQALASVISIGAILSGIQFWYANIYQPSTAAPTLSVSATFVGKPRLVGNRYALDAQVQIRNDGARVLTVLGSEYIASTAPANGSSPTVSTVTQRLRAAVDTGGSVRWYGDSTPESVALSGYVVPSGFSFEPKETVTKHYTVFVPRNRGGSVARLSLYVLEAKGKLEIALDLPVVQDEAVYRVGKLEDQNVVHLLTRKPRYVHLIEQPMAWPPLVVYINNEPSTKADTGSLEDFRQATASEELRRRLASGYGVSGTESSSEVFLPGPKSIKP